MSHAMVDIECMGKGHDALVMSIGAVAFEPMESAHIPRSEFVMGISLPDAMKAGMKADGSTIEWWMEQSKEAQEAYIKLTHHPLTFVLDRLRSWMTTNQILYVWAHGINFDLRILDDAYRLIGSKTPWHYRNEMDTRTLFKTLKEIKGCEPEWGTTDRPKHDPLGDAIAQVGAVQSAFRMLKAS